MVVRRLTSRLSDPASPRVGAPQPPAPAGQRRVVRQRVASNERSAVIVRRHRPLAVPAEAAARLPSTLAVVLSTYRSDNPDMFIDHELWLACLAAIGMSVEATVSEVFLEPKRRFLEQLRPRRRGPSVGSLEDYAARIQADPSVEDWDVIVWKKEGVVVAAATCERWYRAGGPATYHDSYTTSIFLHDAAANRVVDALETAISRVGGRLEAVVDADGAA